MTEPVEPVPANRSSAPGTLQQLHDAGFLTPKLVTDLVTHQMALERSQLRLEWLSLIAAWTIAVAFLLVSGYLIGQGHDVAGTFLGTVDLVALVTVFLAGRYPEGPAE